jgi:glycerophosphoryl diester phosphodiesterase
VIPSYKLVDSALIGEIQAADKKLLVWTVNTPAEMQRFAEFGVDGIISDNTSLLCQTLKA